MNEMNENAPMQSSVQPGSQPKAPKPNPEQAEQAASTTGCNALAELEQTNPLIEQNAADTLLNVHTVMLFMQDYCNKSTEPGTLDETSIAMGLNLVMECCSNALWFELERAEGVALHQ